jgi:hypothetical protein
MVPDGGLAEERTTGLPAKTTFSGPLQALSPISRVLFQEDRQQAGQLEHIDQQVWNIP